MKVVECVKCAAPIDIPTELVSPNGCLREGQVLRCGYCGTPHTYHSEMNYITSKGIRQNNNKPFFAYMTGNGAIAQGDGAVAVAGNSISVGKRVGFVIEGHRFWDDLNGMPHHMWHDRGDLHHTWISQYDHQRIHLVTDRRGFTYVED